MYKKLIAIFLFALVLFKPAAATVGLGIGPAEFRVNVRPAKDYVVYIILYNPSDRDVDVVVESFCTSCSEDLIFFGKKIGSVKYDLKLDVVPSSLKIEKNTSYFEGKQVAIKIHVPLIVKQQAELNIFGKNLTLIYYGFLLNTKSFSSKVVANTITPTRVSVTGNFNISVQSISTSTLLVVTVSVIVALAVSFFLFISKKERELKKSFRLSFYPNSPKTKFPK